VRAYDEGGDGNDYGSADHLQGRQGEVAVARECEPLLPLQRRQEMANALLNKLHKGSPCQIADPDKYIAVVRRGGQEKTAKLRMNRTKVLTWTGDLSEGI